MEATEFTVRAIESENRSASIKRDKPHLEGCVAIEMSAQPLLELTPMTGRTSRTAFTQSILKRALVSVSLYHSVWVVLTSDKSSH